MLDVLVDRRAVARSLRPDRFRLMLSVDSNRLYAGGGQLERIRLIGLGVATPNGRASLRFDFLGQTCGDEFRCDLLCRRAPQLRGIAKRRSSRSAAALSNSRCLSLSLNDIFEPSVSRRAEPIRPLTEASPGSARSPGRRVLRQLRRPPITTFTLSFEWKASPFFATCTPNLRIPAILWATESQGSRPGNARARERSARWWLVTPGNPLKSRPINRLKMSRLSRECVPTSTSR